MPRAQSNATPAGGSLALHLTVATLLAVTGATALMLEVVWARWLTLALGSSTRASLVVLATFMAGLGLGSLVGGRLADARPRLCLALFAGAETLVALLSLALIPILRWWLPDWSAGLARWSGAETLPMNLRVALAVAVLLPPTIPMGATLPLLARWIVETGSAPGRGIGRLYAFNTLGAASGPLLAAFFLVDALGLTGSVVVSALADLGVAGVAFALAAGRQESPRPSRAGRRAAFEKPAGPALPGFRSLLAVAALGFFISGVVGLGLEVAFLRILSVLSGSTAYAFSVMLSAFLLGIALGSVAASRLADRGARPAAALGLTLAGLGAGLGLSLRLLEMGAYERVGRLFGTGWAYAFEMGGCLASLLPSTLMLGAVVPLIARMTAGRPETVGSAFGLAYALNTFGAVLGTLAAGLFLIPSLGTAGTIRVLAGTAAIAGIAILTITSERRALLGHGLGAIALGALGLVACLGADPVARTFLGRLASWRILAFREGPVQTIAVVEDDDDRELLYRRLFTNKTSLAGTNLYGQRYMRLLGHLPVLWARDPADRTLVIGLGTGNTLAAVVSHPEVREIHVAEISPEVVGVAPLFQEGARGALDDPRVRLLIEDGRHVLLSAREPWDVITLEPPPPRDSGVVSLYTTDFYHLCLERLRPGGALAQWIPLHSQSTEEIRMLVRAFLDAFPHALGFLPLERDLILIGSGQPLSAEPQEIARRMSAETTRRSLQRIGFEEPADLLATALLDRERLVAMAADAPPLTDDRPRVEYFARYGKNPPRPVVGELFRDPVPMEALLRAPPSGDFSARFARGREALRACLLSAYARDAGQMEEASRLIYEAASLRPWDPYYLYAARISDEHLARLRARAERGEGGAETWLSLARKLERRGRAEEAREAHARADAHRR